MTDAQKLAEETSRRLFDIDRASRGLGMQIMDVAPGRARLTMTVREDMLNGHQICHGGFIFALADSAFAFACNSRAEDTVAASGSIDFLAPARGADELTALAQEVWLRGRSGIYEVIVSNQTGERIALFRGRSHRIAKR
jgi:acyl-CoA thioesterase